MTLNPYIMFNGQCRAAFQFYEQHLGGKILFSMTHSEAPGCENIPESSRELILHIAMQLGTSTLMASDAPPNRFEPPQGFSLALSFNSIPDVERTFNALADGGNIKLPLAKTFWSELFGMVTDRFGIPWMVSCDIAA